MAKTPSRKRGSGVEVIGRGVLKEVEQPGGGGESKNEKWRRIVRKRLATALYGISLLKPTADREFYEYTQVEWHVVVRDLIEAVDDVRQAFMSKGKVGYRDPFKNVSIETLRAELIAADPELQDIL